MMMMMRSFTLFTFVMALVFSSAPHSVRADDDEGPPGDVVVLTNANFDDIVNKAPLILVEFYAPWCGHCKALSPEYKEAATALLEHDPPIPIAKLDATKHSETSGRFGVSGYPTLKVFRNGKVSDYNGPRKAPGIISYMKKQVGPAMKPLKTVAEVQAFRKADKENKYVVVGFFSDNTRLSSSFMLTANKMRTDFMFGKVTDPEVMAHFKIDKEGIVAFKKFEDNSQTVYAGDTKTKSLESWVKQHSVPLIGVFKESNSERYYAKKMPILKVYMPLTKRGLKEKAAKYYVNRIKAAATEFRDQMLTVVASNTKFNEDMKGFGAESEDVLVVLEDVPANKKYHFEDKFTADNINTFVKKALAGDVPDHIKSEAVPDNKGKPVNVLVGKTFKEEVTDNDESDMFIEFYAPWCGHCKALEPKWQELGRKLKKYKSEIVIAMIDGTNNAYPRDVFEVSGFPTLYLKKAGKPNPKKYEGPREVDDMYAWLKKNSKKLKKALKKDKKKKKK